MLFIYTFSFSEANDENTINYGYLSLKSAILNSIKDPSIPIDTSGLIVLLGDIDTDNSRQLLSRLTNYYLGSATTEALAYSIVKQGKKILGQLKEKVKNPDSCVVKQHQSTYRCLTLEERNRLIKKYIKLIESGHTINYVI